MLFNSISVILPNYNHSKYLKLAINEILKQEKYIHEIIIVDDCSDDDSLNIIKRYEKKFNKITSFKNNHNVGVIRTQNLAIKYSSGKFLYFAAADDFVLPNFFQKAVKQFLQYPQCGMVCGDAVLIDKKNNFLDIRPRMSPSIKRKYFDSKNAKIFYQKIDNFILTGSSLIKRDLVVSFNNMDEKLFSFADGFMTREISMTNGFVYMPELVSVWRFYDTSFSKSLALDPLRYSKLNKIYLNKIKKNKNFDARYLTIHANRLIFQRELIDYDFNDAKINIFKKISLVFFSIKLYFKLRPISLIIVFKSLIIYLVKKIIYKRKYNNLNYKDLL